ncbi:MAG: hypothetical protein ACOWWO_08550 [Peptococcaceae bacterium]
MSAPKQEKRKRKENKPRFSKPDQKWYKSMRILFFIFLGLLVLRLVMFLAAEGQSQINLKGIGFRLLVISFGTLVAWWYVKQRG